MTLARAALGLLLVGLAVSVAVPVPAHPTAPVAWLQTLTFDGWGAELVPLGHGAVTALDAGTVTVDRDARRLRIAGAARRSMAAADGPGAADALVLSPADRGGPAVAVHAFSGRLAVVLARNGTTATFEVDLDAERLRLLRFPGTEGVGAAGETGPSCPTRVERSTIGRTPLAVSQGPLFFDVRVPPGSGGLVEFLSVGDGGAGGATGGATGDGRGTGNGSGAGTDAGTSTGSGCPRAAVLFEHLGEWTIVR